ncbi:MAG: hypothetical protein KJ832_09725 [Gammaproteobacteria bacterium]|nr:hypothetical protein [Gammaproteobacteria bacterium]
MIDILHVFEKWTLMMDSSQCIELELGTPIDLLDGSNQRIGEAIVSAFLRTQNPAIQPIALEQKVDPDDFKRVKAIRPQ